MRYLTRLWTWFLPLLFLSSLYSSDDEQEQFRFRFRYPPKLFEERGAPPTQDSQGHGHQSLSEKEFSKNQEAVRKLWKERGDGPITKADLVKLYEVAGDFKVVHSLLGSSISPEQSRTLGRLRQEIHNEVLENLARSKEFGERMGVNDFGSGADPLKVDAKTDIDFTLYAGDQRITGAQLVQRYLQEFRRVTAKYGVAVDPGQMDIVAHKYEATIPDWRREVSLANFELKIRGGLDLLRSNPEAYFLEGAYLQQVMGRSADPQQKTFTWYEFGEGGKLVTQRVNAAQVPQFFYHPDVRQRHAWGGAVGNWHFFHAHSDDTAAQAKYLLRSLDDGVGLLLVEKLGNFDKLSKSQRDQMVRRLYSETYSPAEVSRIAATLETAIHMRGLKDKKTLNMGTEGGRLQAYDPLIRFLKSQTPDIDLPDERWLERAERAFQQSGSQLLIENSIQTARARLSDWLIPPIKPGESLHVLDENGVRRKVDVDEGMVKRLQYAAFFELKEGLALLKPEVIEAIKKQNPRLARDVEILEGVIQKQKELLFPKNGEGRTLTDTLNLREQIAVELQQDFQQLKQRFEAEGILRTSLDASRRVWEKGQRFEDWLNRNLVDTLATTVGGKKYIPFLDRMRAEVQDTNERVLGPRWMARLDKATSVVEVLKAYAREGEVNEQVLSVAFYEGLSYIPGVSTLYAVQGGFEGVATLSLVSTIPGYGQILLVMNLAKGTVELGGLALLEPLRRDKILLAYQGYLDPQEGGILTTGQKERVLSPRPPLLLPIDPEGRLPLEERRKRIYQYFNNQIVSTMEQLPSVWYSEEEAPQMWREKEFEILAIRLRQYVEHWYNASGPFSEYDVLTVHRGADIRQELVRKLTQDYVTGKNLALQKEIQEREAQFQQLFGKMEDIHGWENALKEEAASQRPLFQEAGELTQAAILNEAPKVAPNIEILLAPVIFEGEEGDLMAHQMKFRAKVNASLEDYPGPWRIQWEVEASGEKQSFASLGRQETLGEERFVTVTATAYDAKNLPIASAAIELQVEKEQVKDESSDEEVDDEGVIHELHGFVEEMEELAEEVAALSSSASTRCAAGKEKTLSIQQKVEKFLESSRGYREELEGLGTATQSIEKQAGEVKHWLQQIEIASQKIALARHDAGQAALHSCEAAEKMIQARSLDERDRLLRTAEEQRRIVEEKQRSAHEFLDQARLAHEQLKELKASLEDLQKKMHDLRKGMGELSKSVLSAQSRKEVSKEDQAQAHLNIGQISILINRGHEVVAATKEKSPESNRFVEKVGEILQEMLGMESAVKGCPEELLQDLQSVEEDFETFFSEKERVWEELGKEEALLHEIASTAALHEANQEADASLFVLEVFVDDIDQRLEDAQLCTHLAENAIDEALYTEVPDLYGRSVAEVQELLEKAGLVVQLQGGAPAPSKEEAFTVQQQDPVPGARVKQGEAIQVTLYSGFIEQVILPTLLRMDAETARKALENLGLGVAFAGGEPAPEEDLSFRVASQTPAPGDRMDQGEVVTVVLYGPYEPAIEVPDVYGMDRFGAEASLSRLELPIIVQEGDEAPEPEKEGKVYRQSPAAQTVLREIAPVTVVIYTKKKEEEIVPPTGPIYSASGATEEGFFVVARGYMPKFPEVDEKDTRKPSQILRSMNVGSITLKPMDDPTVFHIDLDGTTAYGKGFFQQNKQFSFEVELNLTGKEGTFVVSGALLYRVETILNRYEDLQAFQGQLAKEAREGAGLKYIRLHSANGRFQEAGREKETSYQLSGGPLEGGWPSGMRRKNVELMAQVLELMDCWIATTIYPPSSEQLKILRGFRDGPLSQTEWGRRLIGKYYRSGPSMANYLLEHPWMRRGVERGLNCLVWGIRTVDWEGAVGALVLSQMEKWVDAAWNPDGKDREEQMTKRVESLFFSRERILEGEEE